MPTLCKRKNMPKKEKESKFQTLGLKLVDTCCKGIIDELFQKLKYFAIVP
jgi:hypothetical protein